MLLLLWWGCGGEPRWRSVELWPALQHGDFIRLARPADLRRRLLATTENPALWRPHPLERADGWARTDWGWYVVGERSSLRYWHHAVGASDLVLGFRNRNGVGDSSYRVQVAVNQTEVGHLEAGIGRSLARLPLSPALVTSVNDVELRFAPPVEANEEGQLPLSLIALGVEASASPASQVEPAGWQLDPETRSLRVASSGTFVLPLDLPRGVSKLSLATRLTGRGEAMLSIFALDHEQRLELGSSRSGVGRWRRVEAVLEGLAGQSVILGLELRLPAEAQTLELRHLELRGQMTPVSATGVAPVSRSAGRAPDIVLIVLDAARGDRFPGWDYPRPVVPHIQAMAGEALAFRHAFAECPTTSCSVPSMITGVSFLTGGSVRSGQKLDPSLTTLAEYLQAAGYRTVGLSATPNNSAARDHDQGFDVFRELWGPRNPDHGPFNMSRLANETLESQPGDQPLYLQLHYLPPHQPYEPGPRFDRFTDPGYQGSVWPRMSLRPYQLGAADLAPADLEHLVALYDGNLLRADAAVGQVFEALRAGDRWRDALIVVTSDHGEAFMEHGRQGHNTTLYDEMLHVPLLLRLPGGEPPGRIDPTRLVSLIDIVPTLLGYLGIPPAPEVDGVDLLRTSPDPLRPRVLFARTSHPEHPMLAARTPSWKAISWPRRQAQRLYHLAVDPGETENLVGDRPWRFAGLGLALRPYLRQTAARSSQGEAVELTPEAEQALRALGYLD